MQGDIWYFTRVSNSFRMLSTRHPLILHSLRFHPCCSMALQSKFVTSYTKRCGLTHFLAIPLVTPTSRSQILNSFQCLWGDLTAIGVPIDAVRSPGQLHLSLGILLRLDSPERMAKARGILQKVSVKEALRTTHGSSTADNILRHSAIALPTSKGDINSSMAPPRVSISSLFCKPGSEANTIRLSTTSYDATHRVRNLKLRLAHAYQTAGLSPKQHHDYDPKAQADMAEILRSCDAIICLVKIIDASNVVPSIRFPGKLHRLPLQPFDARGLLERYRDHVWMENAPLDRVSICKLGIGKRGAEELPEVFSVPLS